MVWIESMIRKSAGYVRLLHERSAYWSQHRDKTHCRYHSKRSARSLICWSRLLLTNIENCLTWDNWVDTWEKGWSSNTWDLTDDDFLAPPPPHPRLNPSISVLVRLTLIEATSANFIGLVFTCHDARIFDFMTSTSTKEDQAHSLTCPGPLRWIISQFWHTQMSLFFAII